MPESVVEVALGVTWEPNATEARLTATDQGTATLRLSAHPDDLDSLDVLLSWGSVRSARMEPPNDEAIAGHRLYDAGLRQIRWIGEVIGSSLIAEIEHGNRSHPRHDPLRYAQLRHWIVPLKECTVEVVAETLSWHREAATL